MSHQTTALVSGASSGIGESIALRLLDSGNTVIALQRRAPSFYHERLFFYPVDLSIAEQAGTVAGEVVAHHDIGMLVNNAGANHPGPLMEQTLEDFEHAVNLNLRAALLLTQAVVPSMRARGYGRIVNIASRALLGKADRAVYSMTKAGIVGLTRTVALELGGDGITVNAVAPGPIATELFRCGHPANSPQLRKVLDSIVVKRMGTPADIARAVAFFLSPDAGFITGQTLFVCGGASIGSGGF